jgi:hypothetical protein
VAMARVMSTLRVSWSHSRIGMRSVISSGLSPWPLAANQRSGFEDLSDLKNESLQFVFRAQALFDKFANHSPYAAEVAKVDQKRPSVRLPVLEAALQSLRGDLVDRA